jgi:hypothetical protein
VRFQALSEEGHLSDFLLSKEDRAMRIPNFIIEHPVEGLIAGILLLALLFGSEDRHAAEVAAPAQAHAQVTTTDKM